MNLKENLLTIKPRVKSRKNNFEFLVMGNTGKIVPIVIQPSIEAEAQKGSAKALKNDPKRGGIKILISFLNVLRRD